jgi:hypothetical protein
MSEYYIEFEGRKWDCRHGGPFDRGSADSYYGRDFSPHYFTGGTYMSDEVALGEMTPDEIVEYTKGYNYNEQYGDKKDWGR